MRDVRETPQSLDEAKRSAGYEALKESAALLDRSDRPLLRLTGKDPVGMLDAVLTNEVPKDANTGVYAMLLNPKGRIQTDLRVLKSGEEILIDTEPEGAGAAKEILGRYAPFSRVQLEAADLSILGLYGPEAKGLLGVQELAEHQTTEVAIGDTTLLAAGVSVPVSGYDLIGPAEALRAVREHLAAAGAAPTGHEAYETARIVAGVPRFGADISPENFPGETGALDRAVSFRKGCYPGQETVARMYYRGHPNKTLRRLAVEGRPPAPGTGIFQDEKKVGYLTSVAPLPVDGKTFALGYLSRSADLDAPLRSGEATVFVRGAA